MTRKVPVSKLQKKNVAGTKGRAAHRRGEGGSKPIQSKAGVKKSNERDHARSLHSAHVALDAARNQPKKGTKTTKAGGSYTHAAGGKKKATVKKKKKPGVVKRAIKFVKGDYTKP